MLFKLVVLCTLFFGCSQGAVVDSRVHTQSDLQNFGLNGRIIDGQPAFPGQFPWQVGIHYIRSNIPDFCGGALISSEWVLTAAQCVYKAQNFSIRLGTLQSAGEGESTLQVIPGSYALYHLRYNPNTHYNDIGLIKLEWPAQLNHHVEPIPLANEYLEPDTTVTVSGWGSTLTGIPITSMLNYVNLTTITNEECTNDYNSDMIFDSTVCCRGTTNEATCRGDNGGPLVRYYNSAPIHVGIVCFTPKERCESGFPSGYIRTASYREWIRQNSGV